MMTLPIPFKISIYFWIRGRLQDCTDLLWVEVVLDQTLNNYRDLSLNQGPAGGHKVRHDSAQSVANLKKKS